MSLVKQMQNLGVKSFSCLEKLDKKPCVVVGNLYGKEFTSPLFYLSPIEGSFVDLKFFAKYEVGSEEGVLAMLLNFCHVKSDENLEEYLDSLDIGYISAECSVGEEEMEELALELGGQKVYLYICDDLEFHPRANNMAKLLSMCEYYCNFEIVYEKLSNNIEEKNLHIPEDVEEIQSYDGAVVHFINGNEKLFGSNQFAMSSKIKDNDRVLIKTRGKEFRRIFVIDKDLKGTIGLLEDDKHQDTYAYEVSKISRIVNG